MADRNAALHTGHRERVKRRFREKGSTAFAPHELVELLLFFGIPRKDTNELAHRLLNTFGSLHGLMSASFEDLVAVPGMTPNAATLVCVFRGVMNEAQREQFEADRVLNTTQKIANFVIPLFIGTTLEQVRLVCTDNNGRVLAEGVLSEGSALASEINTRQALQLALRCNATAAILAHNHPGGQAVPSREDIDATTMMARALKVAGIRLIDHIIVADHSYVSLRQTPICAPLFDLHK